MLKRREECNTNLTQVCRHHWSLESMVKIWNIRNFQPTLWLLSAVDTLHLFTGLSQLQWCLQTWVCTHSWLTKASMGLKCLIYYVLSFLNETAFTLRVSSLFTCNRLKLMIKIKPGKVKWVSKDKKCSTYQKKAWKLWGALIGNIKILISQQNTFH